MEVQAKHGKVTQNMHGASRNYRYVWDISLSLFLSCSIVSIAMHLYSCQLPSFNLFTLHSCFIIFWERDITSELHGTPVHISTIVYTFTLFSAFTFLLQSPLLSTLVF